MPAIPEVLVHICSERDWRAAAGRGQHRPPSLAESGFVHLSTVAQVHLPANRLYAGRRDLVLLYLDPHSLGAPLRWEPGVPTDPRSMVFPHLYGPLPMAAVTSVTPYLPGPDGRFGEPAPPNPRRPGESPTSTAAPNRAPAGAPADVDRGAERDQSR